MGEVFDVGHVAGQHRERLVPARLAAAQQQRHRLFVGRVAGQVVAAQSLHRDDRALGQQPPGRGHRLAGEFGRARRRGGGPQQPDAGSAVVAGDGLRVEAPVARVPVLAGAPLAHREPRHRGVGPVVGQPGDDGEARSAVRAGDERVPVAAVRRVGQLAQTGVAGRGVRGHQGAAPCGRTGGEDAEAGTARGGQLLVADRFDHGQRRSLGADPLPEGGDRLSGALHLGHHALARVADVAGEPQPAGERVHVRAEAHALDHAADQHAAALGPGEVSLRHGSAVRRGCAVRRGSGRRGAPSPAGARGLRRPPPVRAPAAHRGSARRAPRCRRPPRRD